MSSWLHNQTQIIESETFVHVLEGHSTSVDSCAISPDGFRVVSGGGYRINRDEGYGELKIWDVVSGEVLATFEGHNVEVKACDFSPDGKKVVSGGGARINRFDAHHELKIWDAETGEELTALKGPMGHVGKVNDCVFSPGGSRVVSSGSGCDHGDPGQLIVWDVESGESIIRIKGHRDEVGSCAFSPDGSMVVSSSSDGTCRVWDVNSGEELIKIEWSGICAFSPDGSRVHIDSKIFDVDTGDELISFKGNTQMRDFALSPDGTRLVSVHYSGTITLWNTEDGEELATVEGHAEPVNACAFSPTGNMIVSASQDKMLKIWDISPTKLEMKHTPAEQEHVVEGSSESTNRPLTRRKSMMNPEHTNTPGPGEREIRVFISSTFRDMQTERDELVKRVFPQIRKLCEERGVIWGEVDLRWGITEEQSRQGEVLPICLEEIKRCRPYFIGLLGQRYGWVPDEYPEELVEQQPWIKEHQEHSITELEILHGVLNNPEMADHAFFYFRDSTYVEGLSAEEQSDYLEEPFEKEIEEYGQKEAERRAQERRDKLEALKERIRRSDFPVREDYKDPVTLGQLVLEDLTTLVDRLFPEGEEPDPLDRQAAEHEAFARSRADVYIGREKYFEQLNAHAVDDSDPLVVLGESGAGKSALLANWAFTYREEHLDQLVLTHFIGATPHSADWRAMLRRIMSEFKRHFDLQEEIPNDPDELRVAFANWLHRVSVQGKVVLVIDALNQLEDREGAPDLVWLPPVMPDNVRLVVSTLPGRPLDALEERGWPTLQVEPLRSEERRALIQEYLASYSKQLNSEREARMAEAPQTANPLFLRAALEELRLFGEHDELDNRINYYLEAEGIDALYNKILTRYEEDYERERPGLVREAMSLLWAARRGLSEAELLELLGDDGEPLPRAFWSPLYLAAEGSLVNRRGLISFSHDYLRQAVEDRYLEPEQDRRDAHRRLADYFADRDLGPRTIDELPWQLEQAEEWQHLYDLLTDLDFFTVAWVADEFEVRARWAAVEKNSDLRLIDAYETVLKKPDSVKTDIPCIAKLLEGMGHPMEALTLWEYMVDLYGGAGDLNNLQISLGNLAVIHTDMGNHRKAIALQKRQERICSELNDMNGLAACLNNQADILRIHGDFSKALDLLSQVENIYEEQAEKEKLAVCKGNQALICKMQGKLKIAMDLFKKEAKTYRELGNLARLARSLGNQASIHFAQRNLESSMELLKESEQILRKIGDKTGLAGSLVNQAAVLRGRVSPDEILDLLSEASSLFREVGDKMGLATSLDNQGLITQGQGDLKKALVLHQEAECGFRELGHTAGIAGALANQALCLAKLGKRRRSRKVANEAKRLASSIGLSPLVHHVNRVLGMLERK